MSGRRDDVVAAALGLLGTATLAVPVWIWARTDGLVGTLRHLPNLNAGDANLVGFVAIDLMLLQVLLLARLPWLERAWGRDVLTRRHRRLAYWSFWLMLLHVYLFALQRATRDPGDAGRALWRVFVTDRHMLLATIGTALLVLVVVSSTYRARNRLRYETWHWLHLWAYVGAGLVLPHILIASDLAVGWVATFWWSFYVVAVAAILVWRIGVPAYLSRRHDLRVSAVRREVPGVVSLEVVGRDLDRLGARSGQFLTWRFRGSRGWTRGHPYSLSAAPTPDRLRITVSGGGDGGARLATVPIGARALVEGPYGRPGGHPRRHDRLLMVAAGVGVTPFRALLEDLPISRGEVVLVHRVSDEQLFADELAALASRRGVSLVVLAGPRRTRFSWLPSGVDGDDDEVLRRLVPDVADRDVWVCGPDGWADGVVRAARASGVRRRDVWQERFGW